MSPAEIRAEVVAHRKVRAKMVPTVIPPRELADLPEDGGEWTKVWQDAMIAGHTEDRAREIANRQFSIDEDLTPLAIESGEAVDRVQTMAEIIAASKPAPKKRGPVVRHPVMWAADDGIQVLDPDGWRNAGKDFRAPCTRAEFDELIAGCTIGPFEPVTEPLIDTPAIDAAAAETQRQTTAAREAVVKARQAGTVDEVLARNSSEVIEESA